ncbi:MAG: lysoplasmalogenase [Sphingomonas sp.]|uniref:lysoplasmalogenase family protein n=1 Tax=Sphingomonas sp. TaxID=28214 RepID=UPI001AC011FF|nr:lysoplasmalogenase family protein [Sphingomonas sp.]MBN8807366.1 lysoplasmalogenase [Sphingomonas sp.]
MNPAPLGLTHRWIYVLALFAGASYWLAVPPGLPPAALLAWKGSAVALLAAWAAVNTQGRDGWTIAIVLAFGAIGDVLLEASQTAGALAFLAGHLTAAALYWRYRRATRSPSQTGLALVLLIATPVIAFLLPSDRVAAPGIAIYATGLGLMAASAWASRFPRYRVGLGAVLFVGSDLLIFAKAGPLAASPLPHLLIWPLYVAGQALIAFGVVSTLLKWKNDDDLHHRL